VHNAGPQCGPQPLAIGLAQRHKQPSWPIRCGMARAPGVVIALTGAPRRHGGVAKVERARRGNHGGTAVVASGNKRGGGAHRGIPTSVRWRRCFRRRRSPRRRCSNDLRCPQAGPAARCGGGGSEGLPDREKRERVGRG
jgi:hypothetical protein